MCEHLEFRAVVTVARLTKEEGGPAHRFHADVTIRCVACGERFRFVGMTPGFSYREPSCGALGLEARLPIEPSGSFVD